MRPEERQIEVRRKRPPYTNIQNALIWDTALRPQTRWLLIAMLSLPDDWDYSIRGLAVKTGLAKDTISRMMTELEEAGYLRRKEQSHAERGRFGSMAYILTDVPHDFGDQDSPRDEAEAPSDPPCPNLPDTVDPCTVEPCTVNSPQQNKDKQNKDKQTPLSPKGGRRRAEPDWGLFEAFWAAYPRKTHKDRARSAWRRLSPTPELCQAMAAALERDKHSRQWTKDNGEYIPYPASWLNAKPWEDDPPPPSPGPGQPLRGEGVRYL